MSERKVQRRESLERLSFAEFTPVDPLRTENGALAALIPHLGEEAAQPVPLAAGASLTNFQFVSTALSISAAATLTGSTIFKGAFDAGEQAFYADAIVYTDQYAEDELPDRSILATRWGVGLRVFLRVSRIHLDIALNFGLVAAAVDLLRARAQYEIVGIGVGGAEGLRIILDGMSALGDFTYETYWTITRTIFRRLGEWLDQHKDTLVAQPLAVVLAKPIDPLLSARAIYYAMHSIADGKSLNDALSRANPILDRDTIRTTYAVVDPGGTPDKGPSKQAKDTANDWLRR